MEETIRKIARHRGARSRLGPYALALVLCLATSTAAAQARVHLQFSRPFASTCPTAQTIASDVRENVPDAEFGDARSAEIIVTGSIAEGPSGVHARIEARTAAGERIGVRELEAPSGGCASLRKPIAFVLTILLELALDSVRDSTPARVHGGAFGSVIVGTLPIARPEVGLFAGFDVRPRLRMRAAGSYWLPLAIDHRRPFVGGHFQVAALALRLCPGLSAPTHRVRVWLCLGTQLGSWIATPRALEGAPVHARLLANAVFELATQVRLPARFGLELAVGPIVTLHRPRFDYVDRTGSRQELFTPGLLGGIFSLALIRERR